MKVLILGVSGLIGHTLLRELSPVFEIYGTLHRSKHQYGNNKLFKGENIIDLVDVSNFSALEDIIDRINPSVIINCVGITKRKINSGNIYNTININASFPHRLAQFAKALQTRIIHFSTDCVFDGSIGNYNEDSITSASDLYGRTKALGEINYENTLTIRSSFIGQEIYDKTELLDWFLSQEGMKIKGYRRTLYSGVSTLYMSEVIKLILIQFPELHGLFQLSPPVPISKYDLLCLAKEAYGLKVDIIPDDQLVHQPTLNGSKLKNAIGIDVPDWKQMLKGLANIRDLYKPDKQ